MIIGRIIGVASNSMNVISGRVVLKETGVGIPHLLVVICDVDPGTSPEETSLVATVQEAIL